MFKDKKILKEIESINAFLSSDSRKKIEELENIKKMLSSIQFSVKSTNVGCDSMGNKVLTIRYEIPPIHLTINEGELSENEMFKAINMLNLIPMTDLIKLQDFIQQNVK